MEHTTHGSHEHTHGADCGHESVQHGDHTDYLHDGHLHHVHGDHIDEHMIETSANNPDNCTQGHGCGEHDAAHQHSASCGHPAVPHGNHADYLVAGHLHHAHASHCDDHGPLVRA